MLTALMRVSTRLLITAALTLVVGCATPAIAPTAPPAAAPTAPPTAPAASKPATSASPSASPAAGVPASPAASPAAAAKPTAAAPAGPPDELKMGYSQITGDELTAYVAIDTGIFARHNLKVDAQLIAGGANTTAALLSGQIQIAQAGGSEAVSAVANGADLVIVGVLAPVYPYLFEVIPEIKSPQDLVGKKLGVSNIGGSADIATRVVLRKYGIDPEKDVAIIATGSAQNRTSALISGAIQGAVTAPPENLAVEAVGLHPLFDLASLKLPAANTAVVMQRSWATANRGIVQRYIDSLVEANVQLKRDKPGTVAVLKNYFKSDDEKTMTVTYDFYAHEVLQTLPYPRPEQFKDAIEQLAATNPRVSEVDIGKLLDASFVQNAADRGLGAGG